MIHWILAALEGCRCLVSIAGQSAFAWQHEEHKECQGIPFTGEVSKITEAIQK